MIKFSNSTIFLVNNLVYGCVITQAHLKRLSTLSLYSDAETAVGANAYHSEKSPELAHQEDLRDRSQIHSRVLGLNASTARLPADD